MGIKDTKNAAYLQLRLVAIKKKALKKEKFNITQCSTGKYSIAHTVLVLIKLTKFAVALRSL